ncbi:hypothetical protein LWI29_029528 [Acer saccharum]|uniref:Uncharacterized protein n=1 Tax=Acer saccharum TaxID=4024 RepID=A0AA39THD3_ACESA|nr:hypothetical protein LWI29_029528 [Acer saccharum]
MSMSKKNQHILAIPWPASGHILPMIDVVHQLAIRGITITFALTPKNLYYLNPLISLHDKTIIQTLVLPFPSHPSLPTGSENMQDVTQDYFLYMLEALSQLHHPIIQWFKSHPSPPVAILTDAMNTTWTHPLSSALGIKTIAFLSSNQYIASTIWSNYKEIKREFFKGEMLHNTIESWGLVLTSFRELHTKSFDAFKAIAKHDRVWDVSPLVPVQAGSERGGPAAMPSHEVFAWLDSSPVDKSVVYVGFGSEITLNKQQMEALGDALEKSGCDQFMNKQLIVDELGAAIPVCEGLGTIPDSVKLAQILADSLQLNRPERIQWMKIRDKALNAAQQGGSSYKALDDLATQISNLTP